MVNATRAALNREHTLPQGVATRLLHQLIEKMNLEKAPPAPIAGIAPEECSAEADLIELLSPREVKVLRLIALGQTNQQIAQGE